MNALNANATRQPCAELYCYYSKAPTSKRGMVSDVRSDGRVVLYVVCCRLLSLSSDRTCLALSTRTLSTDVNLCWNSSVGYGTYRLSVATHSQTCSEEQSTLSQRHAAPCDIRTESSGRQYS